MASVLIVTQWFDPTADFVIEELNHRGVSLVRFDLSDFPKALSLTAVIDDGDWRCSIHTGGRSVALESVTGIYFRRPTTFDFGRLPEATAEWARTEARNGLGGLLMTSTKWLNHPHRSGYAEFKPVQLAEARKVGLTVPRTLITNDPAQAREFAEKTANTIYKPMSSAILPHGAAAGPMLYASEVTGDHLADGEGVSSTAHMFQERIDHQYAVRLTVVDERMFAAAIHAHSEASVLDWRSDYDSLTYRVVEVPYDVRRSVKDLMLRLGLRFGAFDFLVTPDDKWVFLEINPNGQWAWIEQKTGMPIASAVADALMAEDNA
jgi:ATP-grasp ribosomal peptide maturase